MKLLTIGAGLALLLCSLPSSAFAQADLAKILVGKWEGQMAAPRIGKAQIDLNRTLVIHDVSEKDGTGSAKGEYGISGQGLRPVTIGIKTAGGETQLEFQFANGPVVLRLVGDKNLSGVARPGRASEDREVRLQKTP
jgi:hypothetical protein